MSWILATIQSEVFCPILFLAMRTKMQVPLLENQIYHHICSTCWQLRIRELMLKIQPRSSIAWIKHLFEFNVFLQINHHIWRNGREIAKNWLLYCLKASKSFVWKANILIKIHSIILLLTKNEPFLIQRNLLIMNYKEMAYNDMSIE